NPPDLRQPSPSQTPHSRIAVYSGPRDNSSSEFQRRRRRRAAFLALRDTTQCPRDEIYKLIASDRRPETTSPASAARSSNSIPLDHPTLAAEESPPEADPCLETRQQTDV